jgi:hypothetical protein
MSKYTKQFSWGPTHVRSGYDYLRNATIIVERTKKDLFVFIVIAKRI